MILSCQNICKAFGEKVILNDASFHIEDREKAALIGCNGAGKTTLLRIIMQELSADSGTVVLARDKNIGYLAQYQDIHGHHTILRGASYHQAAHHRYGAPYPQYGTGNEHGDR